MRNSFVGGLFGAFALVMTAVIIADVETHPAGTKAGLSGLNSILKSSYSASLGGAKISG